MSVSGNTQLETMETSREEEESVGTVVAAIGGGSSVEEIDEAIVLAVDWEHLLDTLMPCFIEFLLPREVNCLSRVSSSLKDYPKHIEHLRWIRGPRSIDHLWNGIKQITNLRSLDLSTSEFKTWRIQSLCMKESGKVSI